MDYQKLGEEIIKEMNKPTAFDLLQDNMDADHDKLPEELKIKIDNFNKKNDGATVEQLMESQETKDEFFKIIEEVLLSLFRQAVQNFDKCAKE